MDSSFCKASKAFLMPTIEQLKLGSQDVNLNRRSSTPGTSLAMETNPNAAAGLSNRRMSTIPSSQLLNLVFSQTNNEQIEMRQPIKPPVKKIVEEEKS